ncbi:hypothetical protein HK102_000186 [Quaeritorhiza haematococci]|nr:hypothetical protein HK102_000186 [Quaeritorhiza haematococci]
MPDDCFDCLMRACGPTLRFVDIGSNQRALKAAGTHCASVRYLCFGGDKLSAKDFVEFLPSVSSRLVYLRISKMRREPDEFNGLVGTIVKSFPVLQYLALPPCWHLCTSDSESSQPPCRGCTNEETLAALIARCTQLQGILETNECPISQLNYIAFRRWNRKSTGRMKDRFGSILFKDHALAKYWRSLMFTGIKNKSLTVIDGANLGIIICDASKYTTQNLVSRLRSSMYLSRLVCTPINYIIFALASYFHAQHNFRAQIACFITGILVTILNVAMLAYLNFWIGGKVVRILKTLRVPRPEKDVTSLQFTSVVVEDRSTGNGTGTMVSSAMIVVDSSVTQGTKKVDPMDKLIREVRSK